MFKKIILTMICLLSIGLTPTYGATLLDAIHNKDMKLLKTLLDEGADVNKFFDPEDPYTALIAAIDSNNMDAVKILLDYKADVNLGVSKSPLAYAAFNDNVEMMKFLISKNAKLKWDALFHAAQQDKYDAMVFLLDQELEVNAKESTGDTALIGAVLAGHYSAVSLLQEYGADLNVQNVFGKTPLMYAVQNGHAKIATKLLLHGADVYIKDGNGQTAVDLSKKSTIKEIKEMFANY